MPMTNAQIQDAVAEFTREAITSRGESIGVAGCQAIRAAYENIDALIDANMATWNAQLPEPFKSAATPAQKARLFRHVMAIKFRGT